MNKSEKGINNRQASNAAKVLILGSGFGGLFTLQRLLNNLADNDNLEITMVSDENYFLFSPLLHEVATGGIETRHITYPIRRLEQKRKFLFIQDEVQQISLEPRWVRTSHRSLEYDYLVLALGSVTDMSGLPSKTRNVFTLKTLYDSVAIRNHVIDCFERASTEHDEAKRQQLLTFVVSGGGYTGVQMVTEMRDLIFNHLAKYYTSIDPDTIQIIMLEAEPRIIRDLHRNFVAYILKHLQHIGVQVKTSSRVTRIQEGEIEINGKEVIPTGTLIWVSGVMASPVIAGVKAPKDSIGRVRVNDYLELPQFPGAFALGDCASYEDPRSGKPIPPRAHNAVRQAKVVAHNILAESRGRSKKRYHYTNSAEIVSLGRYKAIMRLYNLRLYGLPARVIWLLSYSSLAVGMQNSIRIIIDWVLTRLFGRDITLVQMDKL
jgi:NADH dehydrogenase